MKAKEFLIKKGILNSNKNFPINLSRDTHIQTAEDIVEAMEEYAELKIESAKKNKL